MKYIRVPNKWVDGKHVRILFGSTIYHRHICKPAARVEVLGGVAYLTRCSPGVTVKIVDHDQKAR